MPKIALAADEMEGLYLGLSIKCDVCGREMVPFQMHDCETGAFEVIVIKSDRVPPWEDEWELDKESYRWVRKSL